MLAYSVALAVGLVVSAPWWLLRMATTQRYREGMRERLGVVPARLRAVVSSRRVVWVHAVSVGEVLAGSRLVAELGERLGDGWIVVVSTTTRTGQALARERFGAERVFYMPLDFAWAVRAYLRVLRPAALVLMESEIWPRLLHEAERAKVSVCVVNARVSDRSFARAMKLRFVWRHVLRGVTLFLAQSELDAERLRAMGAGEVRAIGNLKYDVRAAKQSSIAELIRDAVAGRPILLAGSTAEGEEEIVLSAFSDIWAGVPNCLLIIAPRHPERFEKTVELADQFGAVRATSLTPENVQQVLRQTVTPEEKGVKLESNTLVIVLDTIGDLASMYSIAHLAFVGGSMVQRGGQNPLEAAQFATPVVMGPSFENFRAVVGALRDADAITILEQQPVSVAEAKQAMDFDKPHPMRNALAKAVVELLREPERTTIMGKRAKQVFEAQQGATGRAVEAVVGMVRR